ncbi:MAG: hypothetical protein KGD70_14660, partial [Candidatus Lokiarchaeota archaeon]|nr:hypothetical protein [Candidatus Lokiarchaeota archaeon]
MRDIEGTREQNCTVCKCECEKWAIERQTSFDILKLREENKRLKNELREEKGLNPIILIVIPLLKDKNNKKISSTAIREKLE